MEAKNDAEREWSVKLPQGIESFVQETRNACVLSEGGIVILPFPPLSFDEIAHAKSMSDDWEIPTGLVPIMGDFHDLVCLDYRSSIQPAVVLIDDDRNERELFESFNLFIEALCIAPNTSEKTDGIIESESWLDF